MDSALNPERINYIFRNMDDAVCLAGRSGELLFANPAAENLFGLQADGKTKIWESIPFVPENDALVQLFIDGVMEKRKSVHSLVDYVNQQGNSFHLHVSLTCESEESRMILVVISDLTRLIKVHSAFTRYTSPEIADYVLTTPEGEKQGGQTREVSILMSDLRGFTAMSTRLSSGELITVLNHYFEKMAAIIQHFRGTIIEFLGDGIFVVFGAPADLPEHAETAAACAVEMQNAMTEVNRWNRERNYPELSMGIGISSGPAVVGNIGSDKKMKYGCMGETVNLAGRMESFSIGGQIHISEYTRKMISRELTIAGENTFMPKGGRGELRIYSITGIGEHRLQGENEENTEWVSLPEEREILFFLLDGKVVEWTEHRGRLIKVSEDEKSGLLEADTPLKPLQDIMIRTGGQDLYAKVTDQTENGYRIGFTMKPDSFSGFLSQGDTV